MKTDSSKPKGVMRPKTTPHVGKSFGVCKVCGKTFKLRRKTKHPSDKLLKGVICSKCGKKKMVECSKK